MYETETFTAILERMLDRVRDTVDKREGSIIYDTTAPAAAEFAQLYIELGNQLGVIYPADAAVNSTADDDALDKTIAWSGVTRKPATAAVLRAEFRNANGQFMDVPLETRFSIEDMNYSVTSKLSTGVFAVTAETAGEEGNQYLGAMTPIDFVSGLVTATAVSVITAGADRQSNESLYQQYQDRVTKPVTSANKYQYIVWAQSVSGVGDARVIPVWNGPGTVKVVILDDSKRAPSQAVIDAVQQFIDPTQDGRGEGAAPIGPVVTVVGAQEVPINISVKVQLANGATVQEVVDQLSAAVTNYLSNIAFSDTDSLVRITRIGNFLLDIPPVIDYSNLTLNGTEGNIQVNPDQVAVLGTVTVSV